MLLHGIQLLKSNFEIVNENHAWIIGRGFDQNWGHLFVLVLLLAGKCYEAVIL